MTAVELDRGPRARLRSVFAEPIALAEADGAAAGGLRLIEGDVLDQELTTLLAPPFDVVANLPYHITSPILHRLLEAPPRPARVVLMVQREVAERIAAPPGAMSYLSVFVQDHAAVRDRAPRPADGVRARAERRLGRASSSSPSRTGRSRPSRTRSRTTSGGSSRRRSASDARCSTTS